MQSDPERRARGARKLGEISDRRGPGGPIPRRRRASARDLRAETIYGEIYQSEVLDLRTRQIVTVAALATQGNAAPQLRTHIGGALRCGVTREELVEIMMQLVPYVGVAAAINSTAHHGLA